MAPCLATKLQRQEISGTSINQCLANGPGYDRPAASSDGDDLIDWVVPGNRRRIVFKYCHLSNNKCAARKREPQSNSQ